MDIMISVLALMFASLEIGWAQQYGPDARKAQKAAKSIFSIMDYPTKSCSLEKGTKETAYL